MNQFECSPKFSYKPSGERACQKDRHLGVDYFLNCTFLITFKVFRNIFGTLLNKFEVQ